MKLSPLPTESPCSHTESPFQPTNCQCEQPDKDQHSDRYSPLVFSHVVSLSSPNLAALIQEVVHRPDWREGNALVLLISGSGRREAVAYGGGPSVFAPVDAWVAPRLYIELAEPSP